MITNIFIVLFVLFMAYWWGSQGVFSSLLHLLVVIVAGSIAFALWEVVTIDVFMRFTPTYAWAGGLLLPFLLTMFILRLAMDKLVPVNMHFSEAINLTAGGFLGLLSGFLTAGVILIGMEFLPMGQDIFGYQPLVINTQGRPYAGGNSLWIPVDSGTAWVFNTLSQGAFSTGTPLAVYQPKVDEQAGNYRSHFDQNASLVAVPESVKIDHYDTEATPLQHVEDSVVAVLGNEAKVKDKELVVVDTTWNNKVPGIYDSDSYIRVSPAQIGLVTVPRDPHSGKRLQIEYPIGLSKKQPGAGRMYEPISDKTHYIYSHSQDLTVAWVFLIDSESKPLFLLARHLRLDLPQSSGPPEELHDIVASTARPAATTTPTTTDSGTGTPENPPGVGPNVGPNTGSMVIEAKVDDHLPVGISKNVASNFVYQERLLQEGDGLINAPQDRVDESIMVYQLVTPKGCNTVRLKIDRTPAQSLLGAARVMAANLGGVWIDDSNGQQWFPCGYVIRKKANRQLIHINLGSPIRSGKEIPVDKMEPDDELFLYFSVDKGIHVKTYHMGQGQQAMNLDVP